VLNGAEVATTSSGTFADLLDVVGLSSAVEADMSPNPPVRSSHRASVVLERVHDVRLVRAFEVYRPAALAPRHGELGQPANRYGAAVYSPAQLKTTRR
jgi:hypothetical protein